MDLSRIGKYFFVLYIYIYSCLGIDWFDFCWMVQFRYIWEANKRILFVRRGRLKRDVTENFFFNEILNLLRIDEKNLNESDFWKNCDWFRVNRERSNKLPKLKNFETSEIPIRIVDFHQKYSMKIISRNTFEIFSNTKHVLLLLRCTMFSSNPSLVTIPVSSKFRHGNYFTRGTRHARRKCHFEKYLVTKYEKWFPRCVRLSISHIRPKNPATRYPQLTPRIQFRRESVRCRTGRQYLRRVAVFWWWSSLVSRRSLRRASFNVAFKPRRSPISCNRRWNLAWKISFSSGTRIFAPDIRGRPG